MQIDSEMLSTLLPFVVFFGIMGWDDLIYAVVFALIAYVTAPKASKPPPATLDQFELPVPDEGTAQCVVFGDVWTKDWEVLWYGKLRTASIKTKSGK